MTKRIGGTIENWSIVDYFGSGRNVVIGDVYGDSNWPEGFAIRTSEIVKVVATADNSEVETLNTVYKLGKPYVNPFEEGENK